MLSAQLLLLFVLFLIADGSLIVISVTDRKLISVNEQQIARNANDQADCKYQNQASLIIAARHNISRS